MGAAEATARDKTRIDRPSRRWQCVSEPHKVTQPSGLFTYVASSFANDIR